MCSVHEVRYHTNGYIRIPSRHLRKYKLCNISRAPLLDFTTGTLNCLHPSPVPQLILWIFSIFLKLFLQDTTTRTEPYVFLIALGFFVVLLIPDFHKLTRSLFYKYIFSVLWIFILFRKKKCGNKKTKRSL